MPSTAFHITQKMYLKNVTLFKNLFPHAISEPYIMLLPLHNF